MKHVRFWVFLPALCMLALPLLGQSRNELKLGSDEVKFGSVASIPLTLSTTDQVQGLVAAFDWPAASGTGENLVAGAALADADTVVTRVGANFMVLGVVLDSNPNDAGSPEIIGPGNDLDVATATIRCAADPNPAVPGDVLTSPVEFRDGAYAAVGVTPLLDNIVVVGGLSIGATEGLILTNGALRCVEGFNRYYIGGGATNTGGPGGACGDAQVLMDNLGPVEGYVVALCHDGAMLTLDSIAVGAAATAQAADFSASEIFSNGGTLGVVIDLVSPFTNNTIPIGEGNHIATYRYCCRSLPTACGAQETTDLTFCDNVLGSPAKENVIVVGGLSVSPKLENGTFTCKATGTEESTAAGNCSDGVDNDCDGLTDAADTGGCGVPPTQMFACGSRSGLGTVQGSIGTAVEVCFFYKSPEDNAPGHAQMDHIQGFSMALTYCCDVSAREVFDISGTIVEAVGAEFVSIQADNDPDDGDGCQLIIGVLVDALPPFDGATLPPTDTLQRVGCVTFDIKDEERLCGTCCDIKFTDGVNGRGKVPIKNLISVENVSVSVKATSMDCQICVVGKEKFFRGDCNFSRMGSMSVDIADAAAVVSFLFLPGTWKFNPPCLDACDCNDDGRIDLADAVCILQYLFQQGRFPPAPGPGIRLNDQPNPNMVEETPPGEDPTADKLDCDGGNSC